MLRGRGSDSHSLTRHVSYCLPETFVNMIRQRWRFSDDDARPVSVGQRRVDLIAAQRETVGLAKGGGTGSKTDPAKATLAEAGIDKHLADRARKLGVSGCPRPWHSCRRAPIRGGSGASAITSAVS